MFAIRSSKRKSRFAWSGIMRSFVIIILFMAAAPIYFGQGLFGNGSGFSLGGFANLSDIRQQITASEFAHDAISGARDYAMTHPGLVEGVKAHRAELQDLRARLCSAIGC
jgi:hypothetical protein